MYISLFLFLISWSAVYAWFVDISGKWGSLKSVDITRSNRFTAIKAIENQLLGDKHYPEALEEKNYYPQLSEDDWIYYFSDEISLQNITVQYFQAKDGQLHRGIKTRALIDFNQPVVSVPHSLCLEVTNVKQPTPFPQIVNQSLWEASLWYHRLAYCLLYEFKIRDNPIFTQWFQQLPRNFSTPIHWPIETISELQYPALQSKIPLKLLEYLKYFRAWRESIRGIIKEDQYRDELTLAAIENVEIEDFIWALECIQSRSFSGKYEGSSFQDRKNYFFFTNLIALGFWNFQVADGFTVASIAFALSFSYFLKDFLFAKTGNFKRYIFCPVIDLFNHQSNSSSEVSYNYFFNRMELFIRSENNNHNYQMPSSELTINYGLQSNDRFLLHYGFVEENNPNDIYDFDQNIIELLVKAPQKNVLLFPESPSFEKRLQIVSRLFYSYLPIALAGKVLSRDTESTVTSPVAAKNTKVLIDREEEKVLTVKFYRSKRDQLSKEINRNQAITTPILNETSSPLLRKFDEITVSVVKALLSSPSEWQEIFVGIEGIPQTNDEANSNSRSSLDLFPSSLTEQIFQRITTTTYSTSTLMRVDQTLQTLLENELKEKPTTIDQDREILAAIQERLRQRSWKPTISVEEIYALELAIQFRIEKKKLLLEGLQPIK